VLGTTLDRQIGNECPRTMSFSTPSRSGRA
jgi:hypothetical protein